MPWKKGQSGNPKGGPKAQQGMAARVSRRIAELTGDGDELIMRLLWLSRGVEGPPKKGAPDEDFSDGHTKALTPERQRIALAATTELKDRLAGKAPQTIDLETSGPTVEAEAIGRLMTLTDAQVLALAAFELGDDEDDAPPAAH